MEKIPDIDLTEIRERDMMVRNLHLVWLTCSADLWKMKVAAIRMFRKSPDQLVYILPHNVKVDVSGGLTLVIEQVYIPDEGSDILQVNGMRYITGKPIPDETYDGLFRCDGPLDRGIYSFHGDDKGIHVIDMILGINKE